MKQEVDKRLEIRHHRVSKCNLRRGANAEKLPAESVGSPGSDNNGADKAKLEPRTSTEVSKTDNARSNCVSGSVNSVSKCRLRRNRVPKSACSLFLRSVVMSLVARTCFGLLLSREHCSIMCLLSLCLTVSELVGSSLVCPS